MWLTRLSLRRPVTLTMVLASAVLLGVVSFSKIPLAFLPQVDFPFIGVWTPYNNGIPSQVEREITKPIEEVVATLGGIRELESESAEDHSWVGVEFDWGRDVNALRMEVQEKVDAIRGDLPSDVQQIFLFTFNSNDVPILQGRISAKGRDLSESYDLIEQKIIMPLQQIPGVGRVNIDGVNPTVGAIYLRLDKIQEFNVDVSRLFNELAAANVNLTVGRITNDGLRYDVRSVSGIENMRELGELPIDERGLRLKDVAELAYGAPAPSYGRHLNGEFAIAFWIQKASGFNTVEVCRAVEQKLEEINLDPSLQGIDTFSFFNQAEQITNSLAGLWKAGLLGSVLAVVILFLFLRSIRLTLVVSVSIPLSILGTGIFLYLTDGTMNILTMMGLMLGIGMLVDNGVVVLESINRRRNLGASAVAAAIRGTKDVGRAIVASTLTTVIVFAPIIVTAADQTAIWLGQVGITISVTIVCSLLISLTVIPALSVFLSRTEKTSEPRWIGRVRERYLRLVTWTSVKHPFWTGFVIIPVVVFGTIGLTQVPGLLNAEFMGEDGVRQEWLQIGYRFTDSVDKKTSKQYVERVEKYLETRREDLGLRDIYSFYGADAAATTLFFERDELSAAFLRDTRKDLREHLPVQAGLEYRLGDEESNDMGVERFSVTLFGEDTELLGEIAEETKRRLGAIEGVEDMASASDDGHPEIQVVVDPERAGRHGIRAQTVSQILGLTYRGTRLPRLNTGEKEIDLSISLLPDDTETIENLSSMVVAVQDGKPIHLDQLADFEFVKSPQVIYRENQKTAVTVRGTIESDETSEIRNKIAWAMNDLEMPFGYSWSFGRRFQQGQQQQSDLGMNLLLAIFCVFFVMASLFESLLNPFIVLGSIPFAILGVLWLFMATGTPFNLMAGIGTVILIGIVVNNGIVLVDHINSQRRLGKSLNDAILIGCADRLRPILMTAGTTILGLIPLAITRGSHAGGAEYFPMARAIIGGLVASTLLSLVVLPTYYRIWNQQFLNLKALWLSARARDRQKRPTGPLAPEPPR